MKCPIMTRLFFSSVATALCLGVQLFAPASASARTESLRWSHPSPSEVVRFELLFGEVQGVYPNSIDLGLPTPDSQGVYSGSFDVADPTSVYIVIRAVGSSLTSDPSNEQLRPGLPSGTGGTSPTTPTTTSIDDPGTSTPNPDALLRVDFTLGGASDWIDTRSNNSMTQDDSLFFVTNVAGNPTLTTQSTLTNIHSHYAGDSSEFANLQLSGRLAIDHADAGIGVTVYSLYPNFDRYYRLKRDPGLPFMLSAHPAGGGSLSCGTTSTGVIPEVGKWYEFELIVEDMGSHNQISASIWERGSLKPISPQVVCTDSSSSRPAGGKFGVWSMGAGQKFWDDFEVVVLRDTGGFGSIPPDPPILLNVTPVAP